MDGANLTYYRKELNKKFKKACHVLRTCCHGVFTNLSVVSREAGCTPFATSLIADYFTEGHRAAALGVYNWGIYVGYSLAYAVGNSVVVADLFHQVMQTGSSGWYISMRTLVRHVLVNGHWAHSKRPESCKFINICVVFI